MTPTPKQLTQWNAMKRRAMVKAMGKAPSIGDNLNKLTELRRLRKGKSKRLEPRGVMTFKKARAKAWKSFSLFVRTKEVDENGMVACVTCGAVKHYKKLHAGHFVPGRGMAILFDERGVNPQCYFCNVMLKGNPRKYNTYMVKRYGQAVVDELDHLADTSRKYTIPELLALEAHYQELTKTLEKDQ